MPCRVVDGEAVWTSKKLRKVPEKYRLHYANWLPLAEANGTFELDHDMIWSRVYACLCPSVTSEEVKEIAKMFVEVGLIYKWNEHGKTWGYFRGNEKPGRLPAKTHLDRYKNLPPFVPDKSGIVPDNPGESGISPEGFRFGIGSGIGLDKVRIGDRQVSSKIREQCVALLDKEAEPEKHYKQKLSDLIRKQGSGNGWKVFAAFEKWAADTAASGADHDYPISRFLSAAKGYLSVVSEDQRTDTIVPPSAVTDLLNELAAASDLSVTFGERFKPIFSMWLRDYSAAEVLSAFRQFYQQLLEQNDDLKFAAKRFSEEGLQILYVLRKQRQEAETKDRLVSEQIERDRARIAAELAEIDRQKAEEDALIELKPPVEDENALQNGSPTQ